MTTFGDALVQLLAERGISQNELGRRIGLNGAAVNQWISGATNPRRDNLVRVEDELEVEPRGWLLKLAGYAADDDGKPTVESAIRADPGLEAEDKRVLLRLLTLARERYANRTQAD